MNDVKEEILIFLDRNGEEPFGTIVEYLRENRGYYDVEQVEGFIAELEDKQKIREVGFDRYKKVDKW